MHRPIIKSTFTCVIILILTSFAYAWQNGSQPPRRHPDVESPGLRGRIFKIRYCDASALLPVLRPLMSGDKGTVIEASQELKTISIRDFPENIAATEEAIKELDRFDCQSRRKPLTFRNGSDVEVKTTQPAQPTDPDVELTLHIVMASNDKKEASNYPESLQKVITQLRNTFDFQSYQLLTPVLQRARLNQNNTIFQGSGNTLYQMAHTSTPTNILYKYGYHQILLETAPAGPSTVVIRNFSFNIEGRGEDPAANIGDASIISNLSIRDGERLVVGSASLRNHAVILVLSVKIVN